MSNPRKNYGHQTLMIEDMSGGIDRREGLVCRDTRRFYDLLNVQITPGRKVKRRVPCNKLTGDMGGKAFYLNNKLTVFSPYGTTPTITLTGLAISTQVIYFNQPSWTAASPGFEVIDAVSLNGVVIAVIKHTATGVDPIFLIHVFDQTLDASNLQRYATYVGDGSTPAYWDPSYPQNPYGREISGARVVYTPVISVDAGRVQISMPNGNIAYCALNRPRVWNLRTSNDILSQGAWTYLAPTMSTGPKHDLIDTPWNFLAHSGATVEGSTMDNGCAEYGVEVFYKGYWEPMLNVGESNTSPNAMCFSIAHTTGATGMHLCTDLYYNTGAARVGCPIRFYARAKNNWTIQSGCLVDEQGTIGTGILSIEGRSIVIPEIPRPSDRILTDIGNNAQYIGFTIAGTLDAPTFVWFASATLPRDARTVICVYAMGYASNPTSGGAFYLTGTVNASLGVDIVGTGTLFNTYFSVVDPAKCWIGFANGEVRRVARVITDLSLTVDRPVTTTPGYMMVGGVNRTFDGPVTTVAGSTVIRNALATRLLTRGLLGATVSIGFTAKVLSVDPVAGTMNLDTPATASAGVSGCTYTPLYASEAAADTLFYQEREAEALLATGYNDAGYLGAAQYEGGGQAVLAMVSTQNRLFVQYPNAMQMWAINPTTAPTYLSRQEIGAGPLTGARVLRTMDDGVIAPTEFGPRIFFPTGNSKDYIEYAPIGDALSHITLPQFQAAAWWQSQSVYVTAGIGAADGAIWAFSYNKAAKVSSWSRWTIKGLTQISKMFVGGGKLIILGGSTGLDVYQFEPAATSFRDSTDVAGAGNAYVSSGQWLYSDFSAPRDNKKLVRMEVASIGAATYGLLVSAAIPTDTSGTALVEVGYSQGTAKIPLLVVGSVIAPTFSSTDETGFELYSLGFDYLHLRR